MGTIFPVKQVSHGDIGLQTMKSAYKIEGEVLIQEQAKHHG
jgi:hypothetical protein